MPRGKCITAILILAASTSSSVANDLDGLRDKYAFDWHFDPARASCVKVGDRLLADFKSNRYRCDLKVKSNTNTGAGVRTCTKVGGRGEYLIFDTRKFCDEERKAQADNE